jgi:hypothetical protein
MKSRGVLLLRLLALLGVGGLVPGLSAWPQDVATPPPLADVTDLEPAVDVGELAQVTRTQPSLAATGRVIDTLDLGTTSITGSQELPKILYIVPWKRSDLGDVVGRPVNTLLDEVLAPVDPEVFERHLEYYDALFREGEKE